MTRLAHSFLSLLGGLTALICLTLILSLAAPPRAATPAALIMPARQGTPLQGQFTADTAQFGPTAPAPVTATTHLMWQGTVLRRWHDYTPDGGKLPLVILLHGAGRDGLSMIGVWQQVAQANRIALAAPDSLGRTWPIDQPDPQFLLDILAAMSARADIDPTRIYLFGHSDGAAYAMTLLNRTLGPWRAAALHAGYVPTDRPKPPQTALPLRLYLGDQDQIFSVAGAQSATWALARMGHAVRLTILPGHDHWVYDIGPELAADAWDWLDHLP
jgi:predicted esterase